MSKPANTYAGRMDCGCVVLLLSSEMNPHELAHAILEAEQEGLKVELMPTQQALDAFHEFGDCPKHGPTLFDDEETP